MLLSSISWPTRLLKMSKVSLKCKYLLLMSSEQRTRRKIWRRSIRDPNFASNIKACIRYFLSNLFFHQLIALQKLWSVFYFIEKALLVLEIFKFFVFSLPFYTFQIQKDKWKWNNLWCLELACINLWM